MDKDQNREDTGDDDDRPTAEERREAEALARALDGEAPAGPTAPTAPILRELLDTAALLRQARGDTNNPRRRRRARRRWWGTTSLAAAAVAASLALVMVVATSAMRGQRGAPRPVALPPPEAALIEAQSAALRGRPDALAALDSRMRSYRQRLLQAAGAVEETDR